MNIDAVCDFSLGAISKILVCQDPGAGCCKSLLLSQSNFQWSSPADSPEIPLGQDEWDPQEGTHNGRGAGCPPIGETIGLGDTSWCHAALIWGSGSVVSVAAPFTLVMWSVSVSLVQGDASVSALCSRISHWCLCIVVSCSCEGVWSWEWSVSPI